MPAPPHTRMHTHTHCSFDGLLLVDLREVAALAGAVVVRPLLAQLAQALVLFGAGGDPKQGSS